MEHPLVQYREGELIIREGDSSDCAYLIESGRVAVRRARGPHQIQLAVLGQGELVGEMGVITEKPRSASVVALEPCELRRIARDQLLETVQGDRQTAITLLRMLMERLRQADARLSQLDEPQAPSLEDNAAPGAPIAAVRLVALTPEAQAALGGKSEHLIASLPCRIGRSHDDPLGCNDFSLQDQRPYRISRHHLLLSLERGQLAVYDRGSSLGCRVRGQLLGGASSFDGPALIDAQGAELVIGPADSPLRFRLEPLQG
jgi:CRP-like cAMP-binding protein